jgi:hypothetical protein
MRRVQNAIPVLQAPVQRTPPAGDCAISSTIIIIIIITTTMFKCDLSYYIYPRLPVSIFNLWRSNVLLPPLKMLMLLLPPMKMLMLLLPPMKMLMLILPPPPTMLMLLLPILFLHLFLPPPPPPPPPPTTTTTTTIMMREAAGRQAGTSALTWSCGRWGQRACIY